MIKSEWLRTFSVLADTKNFRKAASHLHMTQPGVSQHISKLEQHLGQTLINRDGKCFEITPKGIEVLKYARDLINSEQVLKESLSDEDPFKGTCKISMPGGVGNLVYPWLLDLQVKFPLLNVHIEFNPTKVVEQLVLNNECDIGLTTHSIDSVALDSQRFLMEKLWLVLPKGTTLQSYEQLQSIGFIDHPDGKKMADKVLPSLFPKSFSGTDQMLISSYTNSAPRICHHVARGLGYTVLDEFMVRLSPVFSELSFINSDEVPSDEISFIYKNKWPLHPRNHYVMAYLKERAQLYLSDQH